MDLVLILRECVGSTSHIPPYPHVQDKEFDSLTLTRIIGDFCLRSELINLANGGSQLKRYRLEILPLSSWSMLSTKLGPAPKSGKVTLKWHGSAAILRGRSDLATIPPARERLDWRRVNSFNHRSER